MKKLPSICPACQSPLNIKRLSCQKCSTEIEGLFELPALAKLSVEDQEFVVQFVRCSGSLKEMARLQKLSYPTVRNQLDNVIEQIKIPENQQ
ncbi:MAG: DUF2089 family protein [Phycisphaerae bacterium]|jgi:hypothetical protein|nr:DUF2089 family protein [Phycisphaerae bacterium]